LTEVISKLIYHNVAEKTSHRVNQTRYKTWWALPQIFKSLLNHSASSLVIC